MCEANCEANLAEHLIFLLGGTAPELQCHLPGLGPLSVLTSANLDLMAMAAKKELWPTFLPSFCCVTWSKTLDFSQSFCSLENKLTKVLSATVVLCIERAAPVLWRGL